MDNSLSLVFIDFNNNMFLSLLNKVLLDQGSKWILEGIW